MVGDYFVFHVRILLHYVLALLWLPWIISTIFVFVEEDPHGRLFTGISTGIYTVVVFFWGLIDVATFKYKIHRGWAVIEIVTMLALGSTNLAFLKFGPYTDPTYFHEDSLTPNAFQTAFLIFDIALYLAIVVSFTCLLLVLFSLYAIILYGCSAHFAHQPLNKNKKDSVLKKLAVYVLSGIKRVILTARGAISAGKDVFLAVISAIENALFLVAHSMGRERAYRKQTSASGSEQPASGDLENHVQHHDGTIEDLKDDFWNFLHRRTAFRKHVYEHWQLSIIRGTLAIYATIGLALYLAELGYHTYDSGAELDVVTYYAAPTSGLNSVTIAAIQLLPSREPITQGPIGSIPSGLSASVSSANGHNVTCEPYGSSLSSAFEAKNVTILNCNFSPREGDTSSSGRTVTELYILYNGYPSNTSANAMYSSLAVWIISSPTSQRTQHRISEIQRQTTMRNAQKLPPGYDNFALVSLGVLEYGTDKWVSYDIEHPMVTAASSTPLSSTLTLRLDASQQVFLKNRFQSGLVLDVFQVIGSLGGVFTVVSGFFAVIFGRDLLDIITGGWSLSPVGLLGLFESVRRDFRDRINDKFPKLKDEIKGKGMAQFLTEVAIDVTLITELGPDEGQPAVPGNGGTGEGAVNQTQPQPETQEEEAQE